MRAGNASVTAGDITEGKRRYVVRTEGDLDTLDQVRSVVLRAANRSGSERLARVTVGDIATVAFGYKDPTARIRNMGDPSLAINATREVGANVIETMQGIREAVAELQQGPVKDAGLQLKQAYDETTYIDSAIDLVQRNIIVGGALAAFMLMLFLRSWRATVVALAIPVSVIGSFVAMAALGRSLNVISLAGIAFAVGMVVDAAIVVLENIYRLRQKGLPVFEAAGYEGARQVWGAVFVSALTTVIMVLSPSSSWSWR